ncbi:MAG: transcription elongation factor subunit Spt4, partial [Nitrosopumilaceae archaeon]
AKVCGNCKSSDVRPDWNGIVVVVDPVNSHIAQTLGITKEGKYALKVT